MSNVNVCSTNGSASMLGWAMRHPLVGLIDCGNGNLFSVENALRGLGCDVVIAREPEQLSQVDKVILPGVGAFHASMNLLDEKGFSDWIREYASAGGHLLGICLGMQLMLTVGYEGGDCRGLGLVEGEVIPLVATDHYRVPHMGWNDVLGNDMQTMDLFEGVIPGSSFYFVHSFYACVSESIGVAYVNYCDRNIVAAYQKGTIFGTQFHPEKSQKMGLQLLRNFIAFNSKEEKC